MGSVDNQGSAFTTRSRARDFHSLSSTGTPDSIETWHERGYVNALKDAHRLILVDARGHGASDKPHVTAVYTKEIQAADIVTVLEELKVQRADYWGYSMGGRIGFALAQYAPELFRSFILGGAAGDGRSRIGDGFRKALKAAGAAAIPVCGVQSCRRH